MKKYAMLMLFGCLYLAACQKTIVADIVAPPGILEGADSSFSLSDTLTYEVITADTSGWYGIWNDENGELVSTTLDSGTWGNAVYFKSGWKYSFLPKKQPFQMMVSAAAKTYSEDMTINFYKNNQLIKSAVNTSMKGVSKLLMNTIRDTIAGTPENPVLTYEVVLKNVDSSKFEYNGWSGQWFTGKGFYNAAVDPLALNFAIPSGWKYDFRPGALPFTMRMQAWPYTTGGCEIMINFYVNGILVNSKTSMEMIKAMEYTVE